MLDLILPKYCLFCGKEDDYLCQGCFNKTKDKPGIFFPKGNSCLKAILYSGDFRNPYLRELIHQFKYQNLSDLKDLLIERLIQTLESAPYLEEVILVPIPLFWRRKLKRGFNQAQILAEGLAKRQSKKVLNALSRVKDTLSQVGLKKKERSKNLKKAFQISPAFKAFIKNNTIILIDDVVTTGTTLMEAAKVLKKNGAKEVWGLVVARD